MGGYRGCAASSQRGGVNIGGGSLPDGTAQFLADSPSARQEDCLLVQRLKNGYSHCFDRAEDSPGISGCHELRSALAGRALRPAALLEPVFEVLLHGQGLKLLDERGQNREGGVYVWRALRPPRRTEAVRYTS